jgi:A/G-specific adenine glycosylase
VTSRRADALLAWYDRVRRPLPWRSTRDPYVLLVSEVMLQQTQVARVIPYFEAFLARFPDPATLAAAGARDVLSVWSGLGYNRRALALQAAARAVAARGWPADLTELPGVGPYTAAAVASFAWDAHEAAVDVNARRVIERWDGHRRAPRPLAERAAELLPPGRAAAWNQAIMELGATVCTARVPRCDACPVAAWCASAGAAPAPSPGAPRQRFEDPDRHVHGRIAAAPRQRFQDSNRYARGRIVAALLAGEELPALGPDRLERALAGLARDGLIVRDASGAPALP